MAVNPMALMKLMKMRGEFTARHPKAVAFFRNEILGGVPADTVFEVSVTKPGQAPVTCNIRITEEDLALLEELKSLGGGQDPQA